MEKQLAKSSYHKLVTEISSLYESARKALVKTYWEIGKKIVEVEQDGEFRAEYGEHLLGRLSKDLSRKYGEGFSVTNLEKMRKFYLTHKISETSPKLEWSKYVALLSVEDPKERERLERRAQAEGLSSRELKELVREETEEYEGRGARNEGRRAERLKVTRGKLNTYSLVASKTLQYPEGKVAVDCGFNVWRFISREKAKALTTPPEYTYVATVEKVIDGDTVWVEIDCGFDTVVREKIRLRGIDAPEVTTVTGRQSKAFVQRRLKQGSMIVIRTLKSDKYDRYLADVWYSPQSTVDNRRSDIAKNGTYLNQELVDNKLASLWYEE
jgi:endonuclease YncB( thermonuclease family)